MWALSLRHNWPKLPLLGSTALAIALAWLPEILLALGSGGLDLPFSGIAASTEGAQRVLLDLEGMGCEACQLHVKTVIEMSSGVSTPRPPPESRSFPDMFLTDCLGCQVLGSAVDWQAGKAELWVNEDWGFNLTQVSAQLAEDGYETLRSEVLP